MSIKRSKRFNLRDEKRKGKKRTKHCVFVAVVDVIAYSEGGRTIQCT